MDDGSYERLSGLDQSFLHFETASCYMHVALTAVFETGSLAKRGGGIDIKRIRHHIASRLPLLPRYRQRLAYVPLTSDPVWVDDDHFDLDYHVRHTNLPHPGGTRQLQTLCARILERPLDRGRPLWETWFIEGLQGGRFAMLSKVHHCMVDGIGGVDLLAALLALTPFDQEGRADRWWPRAAPTGGRLLRDDVMRRVRGSMRAVRQVRGLLGSGSLGQADVGERMSALWRLAWRGVAGTAETPLNKPIGPHRRVDWLRFELAAVKAVKRRLGGTINDVVLATVAGAVRTFLLKRSFDVSGIDFRTIVPVNMRSENEQGIPGNRVSVWMTSLPIGEPEPLCRYERIREVTARHKAAREAGGAEVLTQTADWTTSLVLGLAVRLLNRSRAFNLIVTNVPGPPVPLYLLDAPMVAAYPHVPLFENQGLGIALFSYAEHLYWGLVGDWDVVPDIHYFADCLNLAFAELCAAAKVDPDSASPERRPALHRVRARDAHQVA